MENKSECCNAEILLFDEGGQCLNCGEQCPLPENVVERHSSGEPVLLKEDSNINPAL